MSLDKVFQKIQTEIKDLTPLLELFFEDSIQPSVSDCEKLQRQIVMLQENLAVYKYQKQNKELSPSFNIHARLSEVSEEKEKTAPEPELKKPVITEEPKPVQEPVKPVEQEKLVEQEKPASGKIPPKLTVSLNDKFRFINELFSQNASEYHIAMEQFNNLRSWSDTEIYLNSLKNLYLWDEKNEVVKYFYSLIKKRFE